MSAVWIVLQAALVLVVLVLLIYTLRHYVFTLQRLFGRQRQLHTGLAHVEWPRVVVFIAAHNEEVVIADILHALLAIDYPRDRLVLMPLNDRSTDGTRAIIDKIATLNPGRIRPFHRSGGKPGKAAALKDATALVRAHDLGEIIVVFDADYLPSRGLLRQLVSPFQDPEVGAVMGRVMPKNTPANLLTRLQVLERSGGYQVDQQARGNFNAVVQYGGTCGGLRLTAIDAAGGWHDDVLAEDTDMTFRLLLSGWKTMYLNHAECYEEVPQSWPVRSRQIGRWAKGHNQVFWRYTRAMLRDPKLRPMEKFDGIALLAIYSMPLVLLLGWALTLTLFYANQGIALGGTTAVLVMLSYASFGNFAAFYEIGAATALDGHRKSIRLLPLNLFGFMVSMVSIVRSSIEIMVLERLFKRELRWDKTERYRTSPVADLESQPMPLETRPADLEPAEAPPRRRA